MRCRGGREVRARWDPVADGVAAEDGPGVRCGPAGGRVRGSPGRVVIVTYGAKVTWVVILGLRRVSQGRGKGSADSVMVTESVEV